MLEGLYKFPISVFRDMKKSSLYHSELTNIFYLIEKISKSNRENRDLKFASFENWHLFTVHQIYSFLFYKIADKTYFFSLSVCLLSSAFDSERERGII